MDSNELFKEIKKLIDDQTKRFAQQDARFETMLARQNEHADERITKQDEHFEALLAKQNADTSNRVAEQDARFEAMLARQNEHLDAVIHEQKLWVQEQLDRQTLRIELKIENDVTKKLDALFDGYQITHDKQEELDSRIGSLEKRVDKLEIKAC
ncbi:hypothetical protein IZU99_06600 [Oscillospiraceae bacterium CM]|nr:hypothetical protein IZU99_06600 [Oscillospiraceae bacterium CM]